MRKLVLAAAALAHLACLAGFGAVATGCKAPGSAKLEGRWHGTKADGASPETQAAANTFAQGTEIVVHGNQIVISTPSAKNVSASYTLDREDKSTVVLHTDRDGPAETFTFTDDTTMLWRIDEKQSIVFKKQPK